MKNNSFSSEKIRINTTTFISLSVLSDVNAVVIKITSVMLGGMLKLDFNGNPGFLFRDVMIFDNFEINEF